MNNINLPKSKSQLDYLQIITLCLLILAIPGLLQGQNRNKKHKRPEWVDNVQSKYNDKLYLASLGVGDSHDAAKKKAAAGIAERFETTINVEQSYLQRYNSLTDYKGSTSELGSEDMEKQIDTHTNETLLNIAFGDFYTDENARIYVIGYIDRIQTAPIYVDKIMRNDRQIDNYWTKGKKMYGNPDGKYSYINAAYIISLHSEQLRRQLAIINQNSIPLTIVSHGEIAEARTKAASSIKFSVSVGNDTDQKIASKLTEMLTKNGFQVISEENTATLNIKANIDLQSIGLERKELEFISWELKLEVIDVEGNTILALNKMARDGGKSINTAKKMVYRSIYKYLETNFSNELSGYFDKNVLREKF